MTVKGFAAFDAILFWSQVAWVCETVSDEYWYVSQGSTPERAVECFKDGLRMTAMLQMNEGHEPFKSDRLKTPDEIVKRWRNALLKSQHPTPQKGKDYRFVVTVNWSDNEVSPFFKKNGKVNRVRSKR